MKKLLSLLLIASMIFAASCAAQVDNVESGTNAAETTAAETEKPRDAPEIMEYDYEGRTFTILYPLWSLYKEYYFSESQTGDAVDDAIFERTSTIEENLNIDIVASSVDYIDKIYSPVQKAVMAGDPAYDLVLLHNSTGLGNYVSNQLVMNWEEIETVDLDKDYWNQSVRSNFTFNGIQPFASSNFIIPDVNTVFFNTQLAESYNLGDIYTVVENGEWTWDLLNEYSAAVSLDIDGDGVMSDNDQYGFVGETGWQFASIPTASDLYIVTTGDDGVPYISIYSEEMVSLIDKLTAIIKDSSISYTWEYAQKYDPNAGGVPPVSFDSGKALFYLVPLSLAPTFRETDVSFGIIPIPKLDAAQESYTTLNWAGFMCVPLSVSDSDCVGVVCENLAYYNTSLVLPAFNDILLGQKISRDEQSSEILNMIFDNNVYDLGVNIGLYILTHDVINAGGGFSSFYAKKESSFAATLEDYYDAYSAYQAGN